jgi:hypothetical protein
MTIPPPGRRVYSVATNMKRTIRPALQIAGEPLVELDVRSSQPLLLGALCL